MKSSKILIAAVAMMTVLFSGCEKEVFTGIDTSKAGVKDFTYDDVNSSSTAVAFYWDAAEALKAGATSFSVQLAKEADFRDVDMYDASIGKTVQATAKLNDAVVFSGLKEYTMYYARIRANYPRSIFSDWTVLTQDGEMACVSVGHGIVVMAFAAPGNILLNAPSYSRILVSWGVVGLAEGYVAEYKKASDSAWTALYEGPDASAEITGAEAETAYEVRVKAYRTVDGNKEYTDYASETVTTPAKPDFEPQIKTKEQLITFFSEIAATSGAADSYTIENDIDLGGAEIAVVENFGGSLDGKNFTVKNFKAADGIFATLTGTLKNIKFAGIELGNGLINSTTEAALVSGISVDATSKVSFPEPGAATNYGTIVNTNAGTVENCSSAVKYEQTFAAFPKASINIGGIVGASTGLVKGCTNTGARSIRVEAPATGAYHGIGGVVGFFQGSADKVMVQDCTNEGAVEFTFVSASYFCNGGVVGCTPGTEGKSATFVDYGTVSGCINKGSVYVHYINGGSGAYPNVGGVAAYVEGKVNDCENFGDLSIECDSESSTWTCVREGGVAGTASMGAKNCKNHGKLSCKALVAGGTAGNKYAGNIASSCFGGVIANAGPYNPDGSNVFEGCVNDADIDLTVNSITETPNSYMGAVFGNVTGQIKGCSNTGKMTVTSPEGITRLGGIAGGCQYAVSDCTNAADITIIVTCVTSTTWRGFAGGIIGDYSAAGDVTMTKCTNSGAVAMKSKATTASSKICAAGGLVGCKKAGATITFAECACTGAVTTDQGTSAADCGGDYN